MQINDVIQSLRNKALDYTEDSQGDISVHMVIDNDPTEKVVVTWKDGNLVGANRHEYKLVLDTVGFFDERFNTLLVITSLLKCSVTNIDTNEKIELTDITTKTEPKWSRTPVNLNDNQADKPNIVIALSRKQLNTIISSIKIYMGKVQLAEGDVCYPFSIA